MYARIALSVGAILFAGAAVATGTGAFFTDTANSTSNSFSTGSLTLKLSQATGEDDESPQNTLSTGWNFNNLAPGGDTETAKIDLHNTGSIDAESFNLGVASWSGDTGTMPSQLRITEMTLAGQNLLEGGAGANIGDYTAPDTGACTSVVTPGNLASTMGSVSSGDVVCVDTGDYAPGLMTVNKDNITVVGLNDPDGTNEATIDGQMEIDADGVTVKGLEWTGENNSYGIRVESNSDITVTHNVFTKIGSDLDTGSVQAIYYNGGGSISTSNLEFTANRFSNIGNTDMLPPNSGSSAKAIYIGDTAGSGDITDVTVANNVIDGVFVSGNTYSNGGRGAYGFMANFGGNTKNLVVRNNSIENLSGWWSTAIGLEGDTENAQVLLNDINALGSTSAGGDTGVNFEDNSYSASIPVNQNNFATSINGVIINPNFTSFTGTVNAKNNWWGDFNPSDQIIENNGVVNTSNYAFGPFNGFIEGTDQNGNGYADLEDLNVTELTNATPGINGGGAKQFEMTVQLDGSTQTQGLSLNDVDLEFTLNQIANQ